MYVSELIKIKRSFQSYKSICIVFLITQLCVCQTAYSIDLINSVNVEPGLVGRSISNSSTPFAPTQTSGVTPQPVEKPTINPEAAKIFFILNGVTLSGNTAFTNAELQTIFKPWLHRKISVAQLQLLVQAVTDKYQKAGYFLSKAILPPQEIKSGIVNVSVIEGFISEIKVQGLKRDDLSKLLARYGDRIKAGRPIKLADLEHYLLLMNDIAGFSVKSVLAPDPEVPLGSTLTLVAELSTAQLTLVQDNFQTRYLGPDETTLFASLNSVLIPGGSLYTRILNSNERQNLQYYELRHDQVLGTRGLVFSLDSFVTKTHPQFILKPLEVFGSSVDVNGTLSYPLIRSRVRNLRIFGQFDYMTNASTALGEQLYIDRIRDTAVFAQYTDVLWKGEDSINVTFDKGLNILGAGGSGFRSRFGAVPNFFKIMGTASRNQILTEKFSAFVLVTGQYANKILPAAETFIFGGPYIGRGYDWAQFTGDEGVAGKAELRLTRIPKWKFINQVQYYGFYDAGIVWSKIQGIPSFSGTSTGFGIRAQLFKYISVDGFLAKPLTTPNATQVILGRSGHAFLPYFQVTATLF